MTEPTHPGVRVGPYRIVERIGGGGMGAVYRAFQDEPVRREVAVKFLLGGVDSTTLTARFGAERRAMSLVEHPGIARILDAGSDDAGTPYIVMELVRGVPITDYGSRHSLPLREMLSLFIATCRAVQHAHQKGIIHRDLKPSNILVADVDGKPVSKIIDFGIARVAEPDGHPGAPLTRDGQIVGTPEYMSPEQAAGDAGQVDTRTDVYSLGAVLFHLLTGRPPKPLEGGPLQEGVYGPADADLEVIVGKAMEHDPDRRYEGPGALADDLERYILSEPILARAPSAAYRLWKMVNRRKAAVSAAAGLLALLVVFGITMAVLYAGQRREWERAEHERRKQEAVGVFLEQMIAQGNPGTPDRDLTVRQLMRRSLASLNRSFDVDPPVLASIQATLAGTFAGLGELHVADSLAQAALAIRRTVYGDRDPQVAASLHQLAEVAFAERRLGVADSLCRAALAIREATLGPDHPEVARSLLVLGTLEGKLGRLAAADSTLRRCVALSRRVFGSESGELAYAVVQHGAVLTAMGRNEAAESEYREGVQLLQRGLGPEHPRTIESSLLLAEVLRYNGRPAEAESIARLGVERSARTLGRSHFRHADALRTLGEAEVAAGNLQDADRHLRQAIVLYERLGGESYPLLRPAYMEMGTVRARLGDYGGAERWYRRSLAVAERLQPPEHPGRQTTLRRLAELREITGRTSEAMAIYEGMQEALRRAPGGDHGRAAALEGEVGYLLVRLGRLDEAEQRFRNAERSYPGNPATVAGLALCQARRGRGSDADSILRRALPDLIGLPRSFRRKIALEEVSAYYRSRGLDSAAAACLREATSW